MLSEPSHDDGIAYRLSERIWQYTQENLDELGIVDEYFLLAARDMFDDADNNTKAFSRGDPYLNAATMTLQITRCLLAGILKQIAIERLTGIQMSILSKVAKDRFPKITPQYKQHYMEIAHL